MEFQNRRSSGVAKGGLTTGIIGTSLGALALAGQGGNVLGNLVGYNNGCNNGCNGTNTVVVPMAMNGGWGWDNWGWNGRNGWNGDGCCSENQFVNRYELQLQQQIAEKDSQIALRDANTYGDQKMLEMYKYIDGQLKDIRDTLCDQAVVNQKTADSFAMAKQDLDCCCRRLETAICNEARERQCRDNTIITYANATFYPKQVADVTVGTTTTPQVLYNPLPQNDGCCNCNNNN